MINKRNLQISNISTDSLNYRGPAESAEINTILNTLKMNANTCILRTRKVGKKLDDLRKAYVYLNEYLSSKVLDLNYKTDKLTSYAASGVNASVISCYDYNIINSGIFTNVNADTTYGQLSLNENNTWSKINRYTDYMGDLRSTPDVQIWVDDVLREQGDIAYNCLDNLSDTLWIESTTYAEHVIKLKLPKSIKPKINSLKLDLFPQYSSIIRNIEYYSTKGTWEAINNFDSDGKSIRLHFAPYDYADQIRITLLPSSRSNPIIGIGNIDLYLINYINTGSAIIKFPELEKLTIQSLDNLNIDYYIDNYTMLNQFSNVNPLKVFLIIDTDEYEIPYNVINGTDKLNLNTGIIDKKEIKLRFELTEINLTSPVINGATLTYKL